MDILFLSHCVPNPPDKGERIRAHHEIRHLASRYRVHLAAFARGREQLEAAREMAGGCASLYVEPLRPRVALGAAAVRFALGGSLTMSFYGSRRMRRHIGELTRTVPLKATVAYSTAMAQYAPAGVPLLLDMVDVDSEKWFQYARLRRPSFPYALEGRRLRRHECRYAAQARRTLLATEQERALLASFAGAVSTGCVENGVDLARFDPAAVPALAELAGRRILVFVGAMDYYPNRDAVIWFGDRVLPALRRRDPALEFFIVGSSPAADVVRLAAGDGIAVTGSVPDVRPYLAAAAAFVAPLRIARGIQNKVLEALAMGKPVLASGAVCDTFGAELPAGLTRCETEQDYHEALGRLPAGHDPDRIREAARGRFSWEKNMSLLASELAAVISGAR